MSNDNQVIRVEDGEFTQEELYRAMRDGYDDLIAFVTTPEFKAVYEEINELPEEKRPEYVRSVLLNEERLQEKGVVVPEDMVIQRSTFGDRRPTLFCVKKYIPEKFHDVWENVNITFDNTYDDDEVPTDGESAWRKPLPVELHNLLLTSDIDLEGISDEYGVSTGAFSPDE